MVDEKEAKMVDVTAVAKAVNLVSTMAAKTVAQKVQWLVGEKAGRTVGLKAYLWAAYWGTQMVESKDELMAALKAGPMAGYWGKLWVARMAGKSVERMADSMAGW